MKEFAEDLKTRNNKPVSASYLKSKDAKLNSQTNPNSFITNSIEILAASSLAPFLTKNNSIPRLSVNSSQRLS